MNITAKTWAKTFVVSVLLTGLLSLAFAAQADTVPSITATVQDSGNNAIGSASIGASVHAVLTVATSTDSTSTPTGTVDFSLYQNTVCSGDPFPENGVDLVNGSAVSMSTPLPATGLSYTASYDAASSTGTAITSSCVPVSPNAPTTSVSTALSTTSAPVGTSVYDQATLASTTATAGGSVSYNVYNDDACSSLFSGAGSESVTNGTVGSSTALTFNTPGIYYWQASYSGDSNNASSSSPCGSEILTVNGSSTATSTTPIVSTALSSSTITVGQSVYDQATLASTTADASGTLAYNVYNDNACSALFAGAGSNAVTDGVVGSSTAVTFNTAGTYYWQASYSGDGNNASSSSPCGSEILTVNATSTGTSSTGSIAGTVYNDLNRSGSKDSNEPGLSGWTINLYNGTGWSGPTNKAPIMTVVSDANGNYSFGNLPAGVYSIEEINQPHGLNQFTSDYNSVSLAAGATLTGYNFGNVAGNPYLPEGQFPGQGHGGNGGNGGGNNGGKGGNNGGNNGNKGGGYGGGKHGR